MANGSVNVPGVSYKDLREHTNNNENPHAVTKAQLGLENVDNTADTDKPVSTAQQKAIEAVAQTAQKNLEAHNENTEAHSDIRELIRSIQELHDTLATRLNTVADSDDETLDQLSEVVSYIKSNKTLIEAITTSKVSVSDIVDNLTTANASKVLSANQGVVIKALIDALSTEIANKAPAYSYGTDDMTAGTSELETGKLYFVYE